MRIRFLESAEIPYKKTIKNYFVYDKYIRTPPHGLMFLATILNKYETDVKMYSENISYLDWNDILDTDIVFISAFTYQAKRAYTLTDKIKSSSNAIAVLGGLHPSAIPYEAIEHCDSVMVGETDDKLFANRTYTIQLLQAIIRENLSLSFTIQVRYEVGFDNEILTLLKQANFKEVAMCIEFNADESFALQHKKSTRDEIIESI